MKITTTQELSRLLKYPCEYLDDLASRSQRCYHPFTKIKIKKDGTTKKREIDNPNEELKKVQRIIYLKLLLPLVDKLPNFMHGARRGRSIKSNATAHVATESIISLDLKDCFPNIKYTDVYSFFTQTYQCAPSAARLLSKILTFKGHLPQGSPSSSALCNLILKPALIELHELAAKSNVNFTQFIDDLFFSGGRHSAIQIQKPALDILKKYGWRVNMKKKEIQSNANSMSVAGAIVNQKISAGRKRIRRLEREIMKQDMTTYYYKKGKDGKTRKVYYWQRLQGKIASVALLNAQQGTHLQRKLEAKLSSSRIIEQ